MSGPIPVPGRLAGQTVIATGASRGIGHAIALRLAAEGAKLIVTAPEADRAELDALAAACPGAVAVAGDLADPATAEVLVAACLSHHGRVDGLVNCAMAEERGSVGAVSLPGWEMTIRVSLTAPMLLAKAALPAMVAAGSGAIVNIGSQRAFAAGHAAAAYEAAKAGMLALTRSLAVDYGPAGIRSNCVSPGFVLSERAQQWMDAVPGRERAMRAGIPLRRPGSAEEIAAVVAFLLSADAGYVNGAVIAVDGGALAGLPENAALALAEGGEGGAAA